jgi:glutaredoxin 2
VIKVRGLGVGPKLLQWTTDGRRKVEELSGQKVVPVLLTDDGEAIVDSKAIVQWAKAHPRGAQPATRRADPIRRPASTAARHRPQPASACGAEGSSTPMWSRRS